MANSEDYLTRYKRFFEEFAATVNPDDQLPVKMAVNTVTEGELTGEILDWTIQYLNQKGCPQSLVAPLCRIVLSEVRAACSKQPTAFGYRPGDDVFIALRLMQTVLARVNAVCLRYSGPGSANDPVTLPPPPICPPRHAPSAAAKNSRRAMEDRHVVIDDLNAFFDIKNTEPTAFYAVYDGHAGYAAAAYAAAHLHQYFIESDDYIKDPRHALYTAFKKTDYEFVRKGQNENLSSGTTAAVIVIRGNILYAAWVGDSQALLVNRGKLLQLVHPHKPNRADERTRIEQEGGCVMYWGTWRVNGQLAVSRAIGDSAYKPYVTSTPDISALTLDGEEDFIILACDGLWDFVSEDAAALEVYRQIQISPDDLEAVTLRLVQISKNQGSTDNISVIVVFLKEPREIAASAQWHLDNCPDMDAGLDNSNNAQANAFLVNSNPDAAYIKDNLLLELSDGFKQQNGMSEDGTEASQQPFAVGPALERAANGKRRVHDLDEDMEEDELDLGPETDVDALDEFGDSYQHRQNNNLQNDGDVDHEIQRRQTSEFEPARTPREETPTPPADHVLDIGTVLVENVADSGEESEDEWNYYKGDEKNVQDINSEELSSPLEGENLVDRADIEAETSEMNSSPLNPEAAPFIPVSPTRGTATSPTPPATLPPHVLDDAIVAESPRKPVPMDDIIIPDPTDFENEAHTKPSELGCDEYLNGHSEISGMSSQENLKENLHGKEKQDNGSEFGDELSIDNNQIDSQVFLDQKMPEELEFQRVQKDITDFCDIQVCYTNPSQTFDSAVDEELFERLKNKERDPMSMSFYQEKDEDTCELGISSNPFDLNAVQLLPNDVDGEEISNEVKSNEIFTNDNMNFTNNFVNNGISADVTSSEINDAIKDLDKAVHNEVNLILNHSEDALLSEELPVPVPGVTIDKTQSPIDNSPLSDNVSQLTEPSEIDIPIERDLVSPHKELEAFSPIETAISQDSALSKEMSSPPASPYDNDTDLCQISHSPVASDQLSNLNVGNVILEQDNKPEQEQLQGIDSIKTQEVKFDNQFAQPQEYLFEKDNNLSDRAQVELTQTEPSDELYKNQNEEICEIRPSERDFDGIKEATFVPGTSIEQIEDICTIRPTHLQENFDQILETDFNQITEPEFNREIPNLERLTASEPLHSDVPLVSEDFDALKPTSDSSEPFEINKSVAQEICQPVAHEILEQMVEISNNHEIDNVQNKFAEDMDGNEVLIPEIELNENLDSAARDKGKESNDPTEPEYQNEVIDSTSDEEYFKNFDPVAHNKGKKPGDPGYICICPPCPIMPKATDSISKNEFFEVPRIADEKPEDKLTVTELNTENEFGDISGPGHIEAPPMNPIPDHEFGEKLPLEPKDQFGFTNSETPHADTPPPTPATEKSQIILPSEMPPSSEVSRAMEQLTISENEKSFITEYENASDVTGKSIQSTEILQTNNFVEPEFEKVVSKQEESSEMASSNAEISTRSADNVIEPIETQSDNLVDVIAATAVGSVAVATAAAVISSLDKKTPAKPKTATTKKTPTTARTTPSSAAKPPTSPLKHATPKTATAPKTALSATKKPVPSPIAKAPVGLPKPPPKVPPVSSRPIAKTSSAAATAAKPKLSSATASKPIEKKPLTNGDARAPSKKPTAPAPSVAAKAPISKSLAAKVTSSTATAPKPTTVSKSAPSAPASKSSPTLKSSSAGTTLKQSAAAGPKPAAPRSAVSSSKPSQPRPASGINSAKAPARPPAPVADKLAKETTNRQISAKPASAPARPASAKVTESKSTTILKTSTKTTATSKTTTTTTTAAKKATSATAPTKPKPITKMSASKVAPIKSPKSLQNGPTSVTVKSEGILKGDIALNGAASITENDVYVKDSSPQQVDNSLLPVLDVAAD